MSDEETFQQADAGASNTYPVQAGNLKKGDYVLIKDKPCKIVDISTSKTGKHGHAKANIVALDIFTNKKYEDIAPTSHNLPVPIVKTLAYQLMDIGANGQLSLMDDENRERNDLNLPDDEDLAGRIKAAFEDGKALVVTVLGAMGTEQVVNYKEDAASK